MNQDIIDEGTADGRPIYANEFGKTFIRQQGASTIRICDKEGAVEALKNHDYNNNNNAELNLALYLAEMDKNEDKTLVEEFYSFDEEEKVNESDEAWSIDALASDTQSLRLAELDNKCGCQICGNVNFFV